MKKKKEEEQGEGKRRTNANMNKQIAKRKQKKRKKDERNEKKVRERTPSKCCRGNWEGATEKEAAAASSIEAKRGKYCIADFITPAIQPTNQPTNQPKKKIIHTERNKREKRETDGKM